jgi:hypothetical protein
MDVEAHASVGAYFHEQVGRALSSQHLRASEMASWYLVNLLCENLRAAPAQSEPLALRFERAQQGSPTERARQLRDLGDSALYVSGFFGDSLRRGLVQVDYYITMGVSAYGELEALLRLPPRIGRHAEVYAELRDGFPDFVSVLNQVSEEAVTPQDLGRLLERWLRTRSEHLLRRLALRGVLIAPPGRDAQ